jgi:hypothetical protein
MQYVVALHDMPHEAENSFIRIGCTLDNFSIQPASGF